MRRYSNSFLRVKRLFFARIIQRIWYQKYLEKEWTLAMFQAHLKYNSIQSMRSYWRISLSTICIYVPERMGNTRV